MAGRTVGPDGNQDMSAFSTVVSGASSGNIVIVTFEDTSSSKLERAAALTRATEKLAEEGWI